MHCVMSHVHFRIHVERCCLGGYWVDECQVSSVNARFEEVGELVGGGIVPCDP